jgi:hypothetical protein
VWQKDNIPCLCAGLTVEKEKLWCMDKVAYVANFCKKPFAYVSDMTLGGYYDTYKIS